MKKTAILGAALIAVSLLASPALARKPGVPYGFSGYRQYCKARIVMYKKAFAALSNATRNNMHVRKPYVMKDLRLARLKPSPLEIHLRPGLTWQDSKWRTRDGNFRGKCNFQVDVRAKEPVVTFRGSGFKILQQPRTSLPLGPGLGR